MRWPHATVVGVAGALAGVLFELALDQGAGAVAAAAVLGGALGLARSQPRAAWIVAAAALLAAAASGENPAAAALLVPAHAFAAGRSEGRRPAVVALLVLTGAGELGVLAAGDAAVPGLFLPAAGWAAGLALRERVLVVQQLTLRARDLEAEREAHAALAVRYERSRIASELHDIVAHAITVMVVQASAGQRLADRDAALTDEAFAAIAGAAREAEDDMGRLVALLADERTTQAAPDLALVGELVARAESSGLDVTLRLEGELDALGAGAAVAYRVVQEGLTNAIRHAAGAAVRVAVRGDADAVVVSVVNAHPPAPGAPLEMGSGLGLRGLRERVDACGGTFAAAATADGGWCLETRLPHAGPPRSAPRAPISRPAFPR